MAHEAIQRNGETIGDIGESGGSRGIRPFTCASAKDGPGIGKFSDQESFGEKCGGGGVIARAVLTAPHPHVSNGGAADTCEKASMFGEACDGHLVVDAMAHQEWRDHDVSKGNDSSADHVDRYAF